MVHIYTKDRQCIAAERVVDTHDGYLRIEGVWGNPEWTRYLEKSEVDEVITIGLTKSQQHGQTNACLVTQQ